MWNILDVVFVWLFKQIQKKIMSPCNMVGLYYVYSFGSQQ
jgi:hypothetical protein